MAEYAAAGARQEKRHEDEREHCFVGDAPNREEDETQERVHVEHVSIPDEERVRHANRKQNGKAAEIDGM